MSVRPPIASHIWWRQQEVVEEEKPLSFYVRLTAIDGANVAVRYTVGIKIPMEPVPSGGSYIYFPSTMICVNESPDEINAIIQKKLNQIQEAWVPEGGVDPRAA